jgi:dTDP-4-amino-4,6-dideoxy-D-galactose acyltransferase
MSEVCQVLGWDTAFFGYRIARLVPTRLTPEIVVDALRWCSGHSIECLYFLADSDHAETVRLAEQNGFSLQDIRVTFQYDLSDKAPESAVLPAGLVIRPSNNEDSPHLEEIAANSYFHSRFYYDSHFSNEQAQVLYKEWIKKSCDGYADIVLVADKLGVPVGYVTCHLSTSSEGRIGLVGVHPAVRGNRISQALLRFALNWFSKCHIQCVKVSTQGRNCKAQRLYQRCGFLTRTVRLWYHKWFLSSVL